ncbi:unnamed protein product, partial [Ectocarpus sp. 12 AP-2014]
AVGRGVGHTTSKSKRPRFSRDRTRSYSVLFMHHRSQGPSAVVPANTIASREKEGQRQGPQGWYSHGVGGVVSNTINRCAVAVGLWSISDWSMVLTRWAVVFARLRYGN